MTAFLVVGAVGLTFVIASLVFDDFLGGLFEAVDLDVGGGLLSTPVIGAFLAAFGFGSALVLSSTALGTWASAAAGVGAGVALAGVTLAITRALINMPTDDSVRVGDMVGKPATVVSAIPANGFGEVSFVHSGQRMKMNAKAPQAVPAGSRVVIVAVHSTSSLVVEPEGEFWGQAGPLEQGETG